MDKEVLREQLRKELEAQRERELAMPINQIHKKPFHRIPISDINPYHGGELASTTYVLGSPGSGKSRFLIRLRDETGGRLVIESGVFDLFQRHVAEYVKRKQAEGNEGSIDFHDLDFDMPHIDGLSVHDNFLDGLEKDATVNNAPYSGMGAYHYREFLADISSGGKSGYPDWLFVPTSDSQYVSVISFPGHRNIETASVNQSIPTIPIPSNVIYLIDPDIDYYHHADRGGESVNNALFSTYLHLNDALQFENQGVPVHWFLSKTPKAKLSEKRDKALHVYSQAELEKILATADGYYANMNDNNAYNGTARAKRYLETRSDITKLVAFADKIPNVRGFDSFESSSDELYQVVGKVIGIR
jgi:hypothetical protein